MELLIQNILKTDRSTIILENMQGRGVKSNRFGCSCMEKLAFFTILCRAKIQKALSTLGLG